MGVDLTDLFAKEGGGVRAHVCRSELTFSLKSLIRIPAALVCLSTELRHRGVAVFRVVVAGRYLVCRFN